MERLLMNWWRDLKKEIKFCEPLSKHTTLRIGGIADIWFEPLDLRSLKRILSSCRKKGIPFLVIGNGSNLLVRESGVRGVVIRLNSSYFKGIDFYPKGHKNNSSLIAGCGGSLERLVNFARQKKLGGCEFLTGIPGTVGGALVTNAGVRDVFCPTEKRLCSIGDIVEEVTVIDAQGSLRTLERKDIRFGYRRSNTLKGTSLHKFILLKAKIKLKRKRIEEVESAIDRFMKYKKATQELIKPSAGSVFKNPLHRSAAELIESCGLKGFRIGDAQLSTKHTNFVINRGEAQARDVLALIKLVQDKVKVECDIELKPEIRIIGE